MARGEGEERKRERESNRPKGGPRKTKKNENVIYIRRYVIYTEIRRICAPVFFKTSCITENNTVADSFN